MKPYRRFHLILLGMVSGSSLLVAGFNAAIDPFGVTNSPAIRGLNKAKPATVDNTRLYKAIALTRQNAKTILLGASRVETALNPNHQAFNSYQPVYNLGIASATVYEQRRYLEHAIATQQNIELVILGIDLWLIADPYLTKSGFEEARLGKKGLSLSEALQINFSIDTLNKSIVTIGKNRQNPDYIYYHPNGLRDVDYIKNVKFTAWLPGVINNKHSHLYSPALENIKIIRDLCEKESIELKAFITPPHVTQFEGMYIASGSAVVEQGKREIVKIIPVWDFSGYNSITTDSKKYRDTSHFDSEIGDLILNRIMEEQEETVPDDFGIWVSDRNIESHLKTIREARYTWRKANLDTVKMLLEMKP